MNYNYRYRLDPSDAVQETLDRHRDLYRQVYNHFLRRLNHSDGTAKYDEINRLPSIKEWWTDLTDLYSRTLQNVVERLYDNLSRLKDAKNNGRAVGLLKWKAPNEYRSFTYRQSGFELKNTSGQTVLRLSKIGEIPVHFHRELPDDATIKQVTVKKEPTGEWFAVLGAETPEDPPEKPENPMNVVGIDVGILKYAHDTDGHAIESVDLSAERDRLEREQRKLSRKEHGSANYRKQQRVVAKRHADLKRKRRDFLHKLSNYYAREYDLVAVEDLDAKGLVELDGNSRNRAGAAWGTFLRMLEYKCEREGTHFVAVDPAGTTKECAACGVSTDKPLWVREHSCPSCGFTADRDWNAAWNILSRGIKQLGAGRSESTPVETALPTGTHSVPAKRIVEAGSPSLKREPKGER
ncbi:RNA-guided endonuclease InsQ/TnpB family protein [Natrialba aegyptia]|uniref:Transposase, IS605 OrfB family protein n=1 Tax=Natrialba aegyptia DSM 13077 TaxID=1227491 RepID=M0BGU6_9EURY|nr:RNA-guided endonuclease TnpB family protein [Natrialba aegyptia]ELZ10065.1 transposase, IS605 OrfB family protein [Natrialba aegyptia DSM 13077]